MFVRFDCGCLGLRLSSPDGDAEQRHDIVIKSCDGGRDDPATAFYARNLFDKEATPLPFREATELIDEVDRLVADGHSMRLVAHTLRLVSSRSRDE